MLALTGSGQERNSRKPSEHWPNSAVDRIAD
jgi:hypothetical protein